jgi:hypothetical protein
VPRTDVTHPRVCATSIIRATYLKHFQVDYTCLLILSIMFYSLF